MEKKAPLVSFITITYNGLNDTLELIESIQQVVKSVSFEIIVVDNASRKNEAEIIKEKYSSVITIRSEENKGFSGGNNLGILQAKGAFLMFINNDTYIEEDGFKSLVDRLQSNPQIGGVSPKIKFADKPHNIQFVGYIPFTKITLRNDLIGFGKPDKKEYNTPRLTPYLHGAAMMIKKEVVDKVGLMPEIYFLYYEELDWTTHMTVAGYSLYYEPNCTVFHKESQSTGRESPLRSFYMTRNRLVYAWRNRIGLNRFLCLSFQILFSLPLNSVKALFSKRFDLFIAHNKGVIDFFRLLFRKEL